jgi:hypothetical protein
VVVNDARRWLEGAKGRFHSLWWVIGGVLVASCRALRTSVYEAVEFDAGDDSTLNETSARGELDRWDSVARVSAVAAEV